jgi:hypothetical protein
MRDDSAAHKEKAATVLWNLSRNLKNNARHSGVGRFGG